VVIPVYNGEDTLARCLDALVTALPASGEIVAVDDASTDATPEILARYPVQVLRNEENLGTSASRNRGWRAAAAPIVAFVDADVVARPDALRRMMDWLEREPETAGVNGVLALDIATPGLVSAFVNTSIHYQHLAHGERVSSTFTSICALRREALEAMGGWDDRWFSRYADDVATRFRLPEGALRMDPRVQGEHLKGVRLRGLLKHRFNVGFFFAQSSIANRAAIRAHPKTAVLNQRYPLNTAAEAGYLGVAGLGLVLGPFALPLYTLPAAVTLAANGRFCLFTLRHRGAREAVASLPLSAAEGFAYFAGIAWCAIDRTRRGVSAASDGA
jgi:glycosyltransferase involved in cell wall biosynthesis